MRIINRAKGPLQVSTIGLSVLGLLLLGMASCQSSHRPTRRAAVNLDPGWPRGDNFFTEASYGRLQVAMPTIPDAEYINDDELCLTCHEAYTQAHANNVHGGFSCEACHGPASRHLETRGKEPGLVLNPAKLQPAEASELCLKCHEEYQCDTGNRWRHSVHAHNCVSCTDCHRGHYNVPPGTPATNADALAGDRFGGSTQASHTTTVKTGAVTLVQYEQKSDWVSLAGSSNNLGAVTPYICYQCHCDMQDLQEVAGPHQICGPNGFNCDTCHDPHGKIREESRQDLCLCCHQKGSPVMAWHSSIHAMSDVACTDCHNPHPKACVPRIANVSYTQVRRPSRLAMSVDEPEVCYKCHADIFGKTNLPSHHPIGEGNLVCSDCHDPHGQFEKNLAEASVNQVCYKCHADKQGPFVYDHPPVSENCAYCHEPHGAVADNLLRQPTTFLCLRCHSGHKERHGFAGIDNNLDNQNAFYTDCVVCHTQIHGTDSPGPVRKNDFRR